MADGIALDSREFLASCLKDALGDPELVDAISDQALDQGLNALTIGSGRVPVLELKDKLYLTMEEAKSVMDICTSMVTGHKHGTREKQDCLSLRLLTSPSGRLGLRFSIKDRQQQPPLPTPTPEAAMDADPSLDALAPTSSKKDVQGPSLEPLAVMMEDASTAGVVVVTRTWASIAGQKPATAAKTPSSAPSAPTPTSPQSLASSPLPQNARLRESANPPPPEVATSQACMDVTPPEKANSSRVATPPEKANSSRVATPPEKANSSRVATPPEKANSSRVNTPQPEKANSSRVNNPPPEKANSSRVNTPLPEKANSSRVNTPLPDKAKSSRVATPPPAKANSSRVATPPLDKANSIRVNTPPPESVTSGRLSTPPPEKANSSRVNTAPLEKAASQSHVNTPHEKASSQVHVGTPTLEKATTPTGSNCATQPRSAAKPQDMTVSCEASAASCGVSSPAATSSPAAVPSYLRPTTAHKARASKDSDVPSSPKSAPVTKGKQRSSNMLSRVASTLLAPTQAFVARVTGRSEEGKDKKDIKTSMQLETVLCSPKGQRVTKAQPFNLHSEMRPKTCTLSKEELDMVEAREKAFKRNPVPKHVHEARPIAPQPKSSPKDPQAVFAPFQLASVERHNKKVEEMRKKAEEEAAREEEARRFKARAYDARIAAKPITPPKPPVFQPTRGSAPVFASDARIAHHREVVEPAKKAKEEQTLKEQQEAERKAKEQEGLELEDFRKSLVFKARPMPDFSSPFRPDPTLVRPVTSAVEPELHTIKRLGAVAPREDKDSSDGGDPFHASLRKSTSAAMGRGAGDAAMRRSTAVRGSAVTRPVTAPNSHNKGAVLHASVGATLQDAIRAAARDAARDLTAREAAAQSESVKNLNDALGLEAAVAEAN